MLLALAVLIVTGCASADSTNDGQAAQSTSVAAVGSGDADVVVSADGCSTDRIDLPANTDPLIRIVNASDTDMVFTVPKFARSVFLEPGGRGELPVNPFIMGEFPYFCLDLPTHIAAGGAAAANEPEWPLDPAVLEGVALGSGMLFIEQHQQPRP